MKDFRIHCFFQFLALAVTSAIFVVTIYGRTLLRNFPGASKFLPIAAAILVVIALLAIFFTLRGEDQRGAKNTTAIDYLRVTLGFAILVTSATICCEGFIDLAEERLHFIKYALLGLSLSIGNGYEKSPEREIRSMFIATIVGFADENLQRFIPGRIYDTRDIVLNLIGAIHGVLIAGFITSICSKDRSSCGSAESAL